MEFFNFTKLYFTIRQLKSLYHTLCFGKQKTLQKFLGNLEKNEIGNLHPIPNR